MVTYKEGEEVDYTVTQKLTREKAVAIVQEKTQRLKADIKQRTGFGKAQEGAGGEMEGYVYDRVSKSYYPDPNYSGPVKVREGHGVVAMEGGGYGMPQTSQEAWKTWATVPQPMRAAMETAETAKEVPSGTGGAEMVNLYAMKSAPRSEYEAKIQSKGAPEGSVEESIVEKETRSPITQSGIARRMSAQELAGGGSVRAINEGFKSDTTGIDVTPSAKAVTKMYAEKVDQGTFIDPGATPGHKVDAQEYIAHHAGSFGTAEGASLGAGLKNLFSDEYAVIDVAPQVQAVVNPKSGTMEVIHDKPLSAEEKLDIIRSVDKVGDTPNQVNFLESGSPPVVSSGGAVSKLSSGMLLVLVGCLAAAWYLMRGK